ncbi:hypothetical protein [Tabrizicola aquatica]|uniref:hypothetical protein n=1 Tax=Tabrizicola aquatica TaxID=909926 RepID=UPI000CD0E051|nr:hypothetical protein [Tabrizicola aquatica]
MISHQTTKPPELDLTVVAEIASHQVTYGEYQSAMHLLELVAALQPLSPEQHHDLCQCYYALGRTDDLDRTLAALWQVSRTRKAQRMRAIVLKLRGQFTAALQLFRATFPPAALSAERRK